MTLKIGQITYANCAPFFHFLKDAGFTGEVVQGVPSHLNRLLAAGEIDASPSSSFEYGLHWKDYLLLPNLSISSIGPVKSVLLFSSHPLPEMTHETVWVTGESATSVNLLKVLLQEFCGIPNVVSRVPNRPIETLVSEGRPVLLIGDRALRGARQKPGHVQVFDLGELWHHFTGLPFVFALWILRRETAENHPEDVSAFLRQLEISRNRALRSLTQLASVETSGVLSSQEELVDYWNAMSYDLTEGHLEGLRLFFFLCRKHGLLEEVPPFTFFSDYPSRTAESPK